MPLRTTALITAFSPGQSPPPVSNPMRTGGTIYPAVTISGLPRTITPLPAALLAALALAGCLGGEERSPRIQGQTVTVYTSLPQSGVSAPAARATAAGERLALADAGGRAAGLDVKLVELDSAKPGGRLWDP